MFMACFMLPLMNAHAQPRCMSEKSVLSRSVLIEYQGHGVGSGVVYDREHILTNHHVIAGNRFIWVYVPDEMRSIRGDVVAAMKKPDVALIRLREPLRTRHAALELGKMPAAQSPLQMGGFAFGHKHRLGVVTGQVEGYDNEHKLLLARMNEWVHPGDSGSGVFACDGTLVGLQKGNFASHNQPERAAIEPVAAIERVLNAGLPQPLYAGQFRD